MNRPEIIAWLREEDDARLCELWEIADRIRWKNAGNDVHLRGLVEISNHCARECSYCGLRAPNRGVKRYRMSADEIITCAHKAVELGYGTVVVQSGEDYGIEALWLADIIREIKADTPMAVTLSLGERPEADLAAWREAGADRYLIRFETSNRALYDRVHPPLNARRSDRFAILRQLALLGYECGSGVLVGIPGQSCEDLARDIEMFREMNLHMIGLGPYLPHPDTPLAHEAGTSPGFDSALMAFKVLALARINCPKANIPCTTAMAIASGEDGHTLGLMRGANVVMPNLTPMRYRNLYEIYPEKGGITAGAASIDASIRRMIASLGRCVGVGRGNSKVAAAAHA